MLEMRADLGLAQETRARSDVMDEIGADNLNSNGPTEGGKLMCQVDLTHPTNVNAPYQLVVAERRARFFFHSQSVLLSHRSAFALTTVTGPSYCYRRR